MVETKIAVGDVGLLKQITRFFSSETLHGLASNKNWDRVKQLIVDYKEDPDAKEPYEPSLFWSAILHRRYDMMVFLLEHGADPNLAATQRRSIHTVFTTPLHLAVRFRDMKAITLLLLNGACTNIPDEKKQTPSEMFKELTSDNTTKINEVCIAHDKLLKFLEQAKIDKQQGRQLAALRGYVKSADIWDQFVVGEKECKEIQQHYMQKALDCYLEAFRCYEKLDNISFLLLDDEEQIKLKQLPNKMLTMAKLLKLQKIEQELDDFCNTYSMKNMQHGKSDACILASLRQRRGKQHKVLVSGKNENIKNIALNVKAFKYS